MKYFLLTYNTRPYIFENENQSTFTVIGKQYRHMSQNVLVLELDSLDSVNMWLQQNDANCIQPTKQ